MMDDGSLVKQTKKNMYFGKFSILVIQCISIRLRISRYGNQQAHLKVVVTMTLAVQSGTIGRKRPICSPGFWVLAIQPAWSAELAFAPEGLASVLGVGAGWWMVARGW